MGSLSVRFMGFAIAIIMVTIGFASLVSIIGEDDASVDASQSPNKDSGGYMWVDNLDPAPKVEFDWIDAANDPRSTHLENIKWYYGTSGTSQIYSLPFSFEFYGESHDSVRVCTWGMLDWGSFYGDYYVYQIPYTSYENNFITAWAGPIGGYEYYNTLGNFKVFALEGQTLGERWVTFEWHKAGCYAYYAGNPSYEVTFEIIIYESGLIKMQWLDADSSYASYTNLGYAVAGIENQDGTTGLQYSDYQSADVKSGTAVMFGKNIVEVGDVTVDSDNEGALYAQHRDYMIGVDVFHPINNDMIRVVDLEIGNNIANIQFFQTPDGSKYFTKDDRFNFITLNSMKSTTSDNGKYLKVEFAFSPTFSFPITTFQNLKVTVLGAGAMPANDYSENVFWVENRLEVVGSLRAFSEDIGYVENGGWIRGAENFFFKGVRVVYPGTDKQPMAGTYSLSITDEVGNEFIQMDVEGEAYIPVTAENDLVKKLYTLSISDVPLGTDISDPFLFEMNIDPYRPTAPKEVLIHADSFDDRNTEFDDDSEVFISWEPAEDFESGVAGYYVATYEPYSSDNVEGGLIKYVKAPDTSAIFQFEDLGTRKIFVWALDRAGNPSIPAFSVTKIDMTEVTFSEFSPGHQVWVNTKAPVCSVLIDDSDGSGISAQDLQFSTSTTNTLEFGAWQSSDILRDAEQIRLSMKALFTNGKNNWVRFRAKDVAGNGWTYSQDYNVWVDEERPSFVNFRPFEVEYQNGKTVVVSVDISDSHSTREGSGIRLDTVEYRVSTQGKGLFGSWMEAPISSVSSTGVVHVEMELDFAEGVDNYIQFRCYDNVGNYANSKEYNILVNAGPDVSMFISEPENNYIHTSSEKILFDASGTRDPDGDDLTFNWYSDINGFLSSSDSFFRTLSPGVHVITLVVNDPAHSIVRTIDLEVLEETQINPEDIDTDGDGIYDAWEEKYLLDPYKPDSFLDSDSDLFTNFQEFQNGTDPTRSVSHPPYPIGIDLEDSNEFDDTEDQYRAITLALGLVVLLILIVLVVMFFSKRRAYALEREEEKELEMEEMDYRKALEKKKE